MSIPSIKMTIEDGALGTLPPNVAGASVKIGICSKGTPNTLKGYSDTKSLQKDLGQGPLVEAIAQVLNVAGGPVYACPATPTTAGSIGVSGTGGSSTHTGPGSGTVATSLAPDRVILAKISTGGTLGTAQVQFAVDNGAYGTPVATAATVKVPGTLAILSMAAGTYVLNEVYTFAVTGVVSQTGSGPAITQASSPVDAYDVIVQIQTDGGLGAGAFIYSVDGGNNISPIISIPSSPGKYAIPGTGMVITFSGTFTSGDNYAFTTIPASFTTSDVNTAMDFIAGQAVEWDGIHVVGTPSSAANAVTLATAVDTKLVGMKASFRYSYALVECPSTEGDSTIGAATANFASAEGRTMICVGDAGMVSALTGRTNRRNAAWTVAARLALIKESEDPAWVGRGALPGISSLYRDEAATPFLDEQRFITLRTHKGKQGYYVTNFRTMAPGGSDFTYGMNTRVMNTACRIVRAAELPYLNQEVAIDPDTGFIDEKEAQRFEADVNSQLRAGLLAPGNASSTSVVMTRSVNILSGADVPVTVRIVPKGYLKQISTSMGFTNPAIG